MEKVIHSLDDLYQLLDPKIKTLAKSGHLHAVEVASGMSPSLYARWKKKASAPNFSKLLSFTQNLGIEIILRDDITVEEAKLNHSEEAKLLQVPNLLDTNLVQLVNQFLTSASLRDKYLIRDLLIRLMSED